MNNIPDVLLEQLMAYLDGELSPEERAAFDLELQSNPELQREADLMGATKNIVRSRSDQLRTPIPVELERSIRMAIVAETETGMKAKQGSLVEVLLHLIRTPAFAITAVIVAAVGVGTIVMYQTTDISSYVASSVVPFDVYNASYSNFEAISTGDLDVALETSDTSALKAFFADEGVEYQVFFPEMAATLKGGVVSEHNGKKFAHVVYGAGDHLVYIFEVDRESVEANLMALEATVAKDLTNSKWHWEDRESVGTMFVWESNNVVCSAVSDLRTQDFSALFKLETL